MKTRAPGSLRNIVLQAGDAPSGTRWSDAYSGPVSTDVLKRFFPVPKPAEIQEAYQSYFAPPEVIQGELPVEQLTPQDRELTSLVVLFRSEDSAKVFAKATTLSLELPGGVERSVPALGEEAIGLRGRLREGGALRTAFMWRRDSLFLFVNAVGPFEHGEVLALAVNMDESARQ